MTAETSGRRDFLGHAGLVALSVLTGCGIHGSLSAAAESLKTPEKPDSTRSKRATRILLFHSAYGRRPAILQAARRLTEAGYLVHAPDLYEGQVAQTVEEAIRLRNAIGRPVLRERAIRESETFHPDVLMGFSLGGALAQEALMQGTSVKRLILFHGTAAPPEDRQDGVAILAHVAKGDPFEPEDELRAWEAAWRRAGAKVELNLYPGGHLFTDSGLPDHHAQSAQRAWSRTMAWLKENPVADGASA